MVYIPSITVDAYHSYERRFLLVVHIVNRRFNVVRLLRVLWHAGSDMGPGVIAFKPVLFIL